MASQTEDDRQKCLKAAQLAGISQAAIDAFIRENGWEDICRINSALAPNPGPGGTVTPLFTVAGLTSYSPGPYTGQVMLAPSSAYVQPPASNAAPASTISSNSVATGPALAAPPALLYDAPSAPAAVPSGLVDAGWMGLYSATAAPGAVMAPAVSATGTPAPALASLVGGDNKLLLLAAAAVVAYLLWGR